MLVRCLISPQLVLTQLFTISAAAPPLKSPNEIPPHSQLASIEEATQTAARARPRRTALSGRKIAALQKVEGLSQLETQLVGDRLRAEKQVGF
jgi:hypothetical protein